MPDDVFNCYNCNGSGIEINRRFDFFREIIVKDKCHICNGNGKLRYVQPEAIVFDLTNNPTDVERKQAYIAIHDGVIITNNQASDIIQSKERR